MEEEAKRRRRGQPTRSPKPASTTAISTYPISEPSPPSLYLVSAASAARRPATRRTLATTRKQLRLLSHLAGAPSAGGSCGSSARQRRQRGRSPPLRPPLPPRPPRPSKVVYRRSSGQVIEASKKIEHNSESCSSPLELKENCNMPEVMSDPEKRAVQDQYGEEGLRGCLHQLRIAVPCDIPQN